MVMFLLVLKGNFFGFFVFLCSLVLFGLYFLIFFFFFLTSLFFPFSFLGEAELKRKETKVISLLTEERQNHVLLPQGSCSFEKMRFFFSFFILL